MVASSESPVTEKIRIDDFRLETSFLKSIPGGPTIVVLHEGLGSIELLRSFPAKLAAVAKANVFLYSRVGHGHSSLAVKKRDINYLHHEAQVVLPKVLNYFGIEKPLLYGHSDGASISLIYGGTFPSHCRAVIAEAPHLFVEDITLEGIVEAGKRADSLKRKLSRYHDDASALFHAWHDTWLDPSFRAWNIEEVIPKIKCPVLAIQGAKDQYGTLRQIERIKELAPQTELLVIPECGHAPHQEQSDLVLEKVQQFLQRIN